jgi:hypothetical protein
MSLHSVPKVKSRPNFPIRLESDAVTEFDEARSGKGTRYSKKPNVEGFSPKQVLVCKKCGKKANKVGFSEPTRMSFTDQTVTFVLSACCTYCGAIADSVTIKALFMGLSKWSVYSSHVG